MGADLRPLLDHADADLLMVLRRQLFEPDRRGETRRAAADDQYVEFHRFALHRLAPSRILQA
jgi:hypothetical protein